MLHKDIRGLDIHVFNDMFVEELHRVCKASKELR